MTSILYKLRNNFGVIKRISDSGGTRLSIDILGGGNGRIEIGARHAAIVGGRGIISLEGMPDGEYTPRLYDEGGVSRLEAIVKEGGSVMPAPSDRALLSYITDRLEEIEGDYALLKEEIERIKAREQKPLFAD